MDTKCHVYTHQNIYPTLKKNEIISFAEKLMESEIILLNEISQTQEDK
jgi:hypothetical protein